MPVCSRCHSEVGLLGRLNFDSQKGRCGKCTRDVGLILARFRNDFLTMCNRGAITDAGWTVLSSQLSTQQISISEGLAFIRGDTLHVLERALAFAYSDGL